MRIALPLGASLLTAVAVQLACQVFKVILYSIRERRPAFSWFLSAGGMPSAHSAFVTSLTVSVGLWSGFQSELFAVSCVFSVIIIYDSWRLRGAVQHQAKVLKMLAREHPNIPAGNINENIGHTPLEILAGIITGGVLAGLAFLALR